MASRVKHRTAIVPFFCSGARPWPLAGMHKARTCLVIPTGAAGTLQDKGRTQIVVEPMACKMKAQGRARGIAIAFIAGGGVLGGAIAVPGAIATIWCSVRGLPKDVQRGTLQPFVPLMQLATLVYCPHIGLLAGSPSWTYLLCAPAVIGGTWIGLWLFERIDDTAFRRVIALFLPASGMALAL
jgi:uncharacterized membrane protein YfcA